MVFRFRRTISLIPGIRLNIGKRGVSLSAGVRGARMTLSGRGARTTFGIPGTGMSWTKFHGRGGKKPRGTLDQSVQGGELVDTVEEIDEALADPATSLVYANSGRRLSAAQSAAHRRRLVTEQRRRAATEEVQAGEAELRQTLELWREMPSVPTQEHYRAALNARPFVREPDPDPGWHKAEEQCRAECRRDALAKVPARPVAIGVLAIGAAAAGGFAMWEIGRKSELHQQLPLAAGMAVAALAAVLFVARSRRALRRQRIAAELLRSTWPGRKQALEETAEQKERADEADWAAREAQRVAWCERLVQGDEEAIHEALSETLVDLDFAFEAECRVCLENQKTAYLLLDLPEIEDVIPELRQQVLKDGRVRSLKRKATERNGDYAVLVGGLVLWMARWCFVASPTLQNVTVAAYTQRKKRRSSDVGDEYVIIAPLERERLAPLDPAAVDPIPWLINAGSDLEQTSTLRLKKMKPPVWIDSATSPES